jgi:hypothetical protein
VRACEWRSVCSWFPSVSVSESGSGSIPTVYCDWSSRTHEIEIQIEIQIDIDCDFDFDFDLDSDSDSDF